jgi:hypothetical protein
LIGAIFSLVTLTTTGSGFGRGAFTGTGLTAAGFAITGLGAGLLGFTVTFDVERGGVAFAGGRTTFLGATTL